MWVVSMFYERMNVHVKICRISVNKQTAIEMICSVLLLCIQYNYLECRLLGCGAVWIS
jgi:hypothetical protein